MYTILTLNNISVEGLERLPSDAYTIADNSEQPDAILVRSHKMHDMAIPASVKAIGRAGAGVNNIPVEQMSTRGVPVFNAPGANANAVKELVIASMLIACRNIGMARDFVRRLEGDDASIDKQTEAGKKKYAGFELPGRTLGVVGLGAIGREVANAAIALGMKVIGFDPGITVEGAWHLSSQVQKANSFDEMLAQSDFITFHVPLIDATRNMLNAESLTKAKKGLVVLNFARKGIVDDEAMVAAMDRGDAYGYVCDFPTPLLIAHPRVVALPHLGASTKEAEDNCAVMVAEQIRDYLENGNVKNSVNFPEVIQARSPGTYRLTVANANVPNVLSQISSDLGKAGLNIIDMVNKSRGDLAYTVVDVDRPIPADVVQAIADSDGVLAVRTIG